MSKRHRFVLFRVIAAGAVFSAISVLACSVPVFRYAFEHWAPDAYQAIVFHRGPLTPAERSLVVELSSDGMAGQRHANLSLRTFDLDQNPQPDVLDFWQKIGTNTLPWLVVRYPAPLPGNVWSGPLADEALKQIIDSPARAQIVERLGQGETAVWVLLEVGHQEKDSAAAELLHSRLDYLASVLELPKLESEDIVNGLVSVKQEDLRLHFSVLRLSRTDPAEQAFVKMLLRTEPDLNDLQEPIVFPVFGRGRALYALVGKGINHETIDEAATFLIGKCSCQVKELNPGVDLLVAANWNELVKTPPRAVQDLPELAQLAAESAPATVTISGSDDTKLNAPTLNAFRPNLRLLTVIAAAGLIAVGLFLFWRR